MFARHGTWPQPPKAPLSAAFVMEGNPLPFMLGPVVGGVAGADAAAVLAEGDVQDPVVGVLDARCLRTAPAAVWPWGAAWCGRHGNPRGIHDPDRGC